MSNCKERSSSITPQVKRQNCLRMQLQGSRIDKNAHTRDSDQEDYIAEKGFNSLGHDDLVRKPIPMLQAMKIPDAKAAVDKDLDKLKNMSSWQESKVKSKQEVIDNARKEGNTAHVVTLMDLCHLKSAELDWKFQRTCCATWETW